MKNGFSGGVHAGAEFFQHSVSGVLGHTPAGFPQRSHEFGGRVKFPAARPALRCSMQSRRPHGHGGHGAVLEGVGMEFHLGHIRRFLGRQKPARDAVPAPLTTPRSGPEEKPGHCRWIASGSPIARGAGRIHRERGLAERLPPSGRWAGAFPSSQWCSSA